METLDSRWADLAREIPGFAGAWLDGPRMVLLSSTESAIPLIQQQLEAEYGGTAVFGALDGFRTELVEYDFAQLYDWSTLALNRLRPEFSIRYSDIDEVGNRLVFGVRSQDEEAVRAILSSLDIPDRAYSVRPVAPARRLNDLQDTQSGNYFGGLRIGKYGGGSCTLGINVEVDGDNGFLISAAHCSNAIGSVTGGVLGRLYQADWPFGNGIANEAYDPPLQGALTAGCAPGDSCRWSDTAIWEYDDSSLAPLHTVALPTSYGTTAFPDSSFYYVGDAYRETYPHFWATPQVGWELEMVGQISGRLIGEVTATCVVAEDVDGNLFFCQTVSDFHAAAGDSGGPVVSPPSPWWADSDLYGILWGSYTCDETQGSDPLCGDGIWSDWQMVRLDFADDGVEVRADP